MASYLATATIGQFDLRSYRTVQGLRMYDAVDPDLYDEPVDPQDPASPTFGEIADGSLARQGEILDFLSGQFGPYPFSTGGGSSTTPPTCSSPWRTRPARSTRGPSSPIRSTATSWWCTSSPTSGSGTTQEVFDSLYQEIPADDPFWDVVIGDPGIPFLFNGAVYVRGAMTLQVLRNEVGDRDFFRILRTWAARRAGGNGTTGQFIALTERISGEQLDQLFETWLFTAGKPVLPAATATGKLRSRRRQPACSSG